MRRHVTRSILTVLGVAAVIAALAGPARAQTGPPPPSPVVIVDNTHFERLLDNVTIAPGDKMQADLDVSDFARLSLLAVAESAPNTGRVVVRAAFGPPEVPVLNPLTLLFVGGTSARRSATMPVEGPHLTVEVANRTTQPVQVSLSAFAVK